MKKLTFEHQTLLDVQIILRGQGLTLIRAFYKTRRVDTPGEDRRRTEDILVCYVVSNDPLTQIV